MLEMANCQLIHLALLLLLSPIPTSAHPRPQFQDTDPTSITPTSTATFVNPPGYKTTTYAPLATPFKYNHTSANLAALWNQVGPIAPRKHNTLPNDPAASTAELDTFPQPGEQFHPLVPSRDANLTSKKLPRSFMWGVSSSAYQIEGAAAADGKGPSIWDLLSHRPPGFVQDNSTGDVVAEHYYLYKQDIRRLKLLGIPAFSPSISWPRIFPFGTGAVNEAAVAHYDDVIQELLFRGITPVLTLFHWDTPLALFNEYGAWSSPRIVDDFFNYAKFVIMRYDKYVPIWFTINEPQYCNWQYSTYPDDGTYWPKYGNWTDDKVGKARRRFLCGHHTLLAHAKVAKWYKEEFKGKGRITFKNSGNYYEARDVNLPNDVLSAKRSVDFSIGWFGGPWTDGDYPPSLKTTLGDILPTFTPSEKALIKGSCDFYAIDAYTAYTAYGSDNDIQCTNDTFNAAWPECAPSSQMGGNQFPLGPSSDPGASWLRSTPAGLRKYLKFITKELFPTVPDIVVSEFGFAEPFESSLTKMEDILWDLRRADYYQGFLDAILQSILYDNVNVTGAWAWSIYDNFEWNSGLSTRFGLQYVNYTDLSRTPKASMFQLKSWFREHAQ
ncbi:glycoside hydrolase [Tothia fuscella]|uniref:Glycoside hydrolase n=1 Tax=Tothia fuscella TaxID=1048955 RepID=A0A9P4P4U2_9PEZI|nr:glycoside hydrolase [Tothia fuscella]